MIALPRPGPVSADSARVTSRRLAIPATENIATVDRIIW